MQDNIGQTNASTKGSALIQDNNGQINAFTQSIIDIRGCRANANVNGCSGQANAFAEAVLIKDKDFFVLKPVQ